MKKLILIWGLLAFIALIVSSPVYAGGNGNYIIKSLSIEGTHNTVYGKGTVLKAVRLGEETWLGIEGGKVIAKDIGYGTSYVEDDMEFFAGVVVTNEHEFIDLRPVLRALNPFRLFAKK